MPQASRAFSTVTHARLRELLMAHSVRIGTFKLASGRTSDFFIDCKPVALSSEGHALLGQALYAEVMYACPKARAVAGVALGGCALASAVAHHAALAKSNLCGAIYVRKESKDHGTAKLVELPFGLEANAEVVVLEDTVTTGGSTLRAVSALREAGMRVQTVIAVVDRQEGAAQEFEKQACILRRFFTEKN